MPIRVLHVGLGPIGAGIARLVATRPGLVPVGAVDIDSAKVGRDLGSIGGLRRRLAVTVSSDLAATVKAARPGVAIVSTVSSASEALPLVETLLKLKVPIVTTAEELAYPVRRHAALARRIDALAKRARVAVLATGVNPGFVMDALPIALTALCTNVETIEVDRVQDAGRRRVPFQRKIGAGLPVDAFRAAVEEGRVRHVGLSESITMIADAMGWKLERIVEQVEPKIADQPVSSSAISVEKGQAAGLIQHATGIRKGRPVITLRLEAYFGASDPHDTIRIGGTPPLTMTIAGGVPGDVATAALIVNAIPLVIQAPPGLRTMRDIALPSFWTGTRA